jgi:OOP family OmpA-OmpF porin
MSESSSNSKKNGNSTKQNTDPTDESLRELREVLLRPIQTQLDKLQRRLDTPELQAKDVSRILPEAISLRSTRDKKIEIALEPITEKAIRASIKKDRKVFVDALFPVMGPAIRKAIAAAIQGMVQSFNQVLEHSVSIQGLKWRLEAIRTQKPFAEVVLLHTLIYQVEQVFLIHNDSGLVLQHVVAKTVVSQDPDLVSGMLSAIKDFVRDSFGGEKEQTLETLRVGDRNVWIEHGPHAFLAAVIRGNPPVALQAGLRDALDEIHFKQSDEMVSFEGDPTPFEETRYILEDCLQTQFKKEKQKPAYLLWAVLVAIVFVLGYGSFGVYRNHKRWSNYIAGLRNQPGIVITNVEKKAGKQHIFGLRDPLAPDPAARLREIGMDPEQVIFHWEPYQSHFPKYALQRLNKFLDPPETIRFELKNGKIRAAGWAPHQWLAESRKLIGAYGWLDNYDDKDVFDIEMQIQPPKTATLELKGRTLYARGAASHEWIVKTRNTITATADVLNFNDDHLTDMDLARLNQIKKEVEKKTFFFKAGHNEMTPGQEGALNDLVNDIMEIATLSNGLDKQFHIEIMGHTDNTGTEELNQKISLERAEAFLAILLSKGLKALQFSARGVGSTEPWRQELNEINRAFNRRVTFKVGFLEK